MVKLGEGMSINVSTKRPPGVPDDHPTTSAAPPGTAPVSRQARDTRNRRRRARVGGRVLIGVGTVVVLLALWALLTSDQTGSSHSVPSPGELRDTFQTLLQDGYQGTSIWAHVGKSLERALLGFAIGTAIGLPVGLAIGTSGFVSAALSPILAFLRPIPPIAYLPLMVVLFGIGEEPKIILIASAAFFYTALNVAAGARGVPNELKLTGRMLGLNQRQVFTNVIFPAALPQILVGVNVSLVLSWAVVVAAELVSSNQGIGYVATDAATFFRISYIYAAIIIIGLIGALFEGIMRLIEWRLLRWRG
jgi:ABC-type nitrate/sulfonate/bicarbonate transport system permease component